MATTRDIDRAVRTYIDPKAHDNIFNATPWLNRLKGKARKKASMGTANEYIIEMAQGQAGSYNDLQVIDSQRVEITKKATFSMKQYYAQLTVSWKDMLTCRGPEDVVDMLQVKAKNAQKTLSYELAYDSLNGSATDEIVGLSSMIYTTTNTIGTLSSATYDWWANKYTAVGGTVTIPDIITMAATCGDGNDMPTLLLTDKFIWAYIWGNLLQPQERYAGEYNMAKDLPSVAGFPMMWDAQLESSGATGGNIYFINENYFGWDVHSADNLKYWPYAKADTQFAFKCQWTISLVQRITNRKRQGRLGTITTS
jgi:uncharacterized protein YggU (UPF0235/DUF167 family)